MQYHTGNLGKLKTGMNAKNKVKVVVLIGEAAGWREVTSGVPSGQV